MGNTIETIPRKKTLIISNIRIMKIIEIIIKKTNGTIKNMITRSMTMKTRSLISTATRGTTLSTLSRMITRTQVATKK